MRRVLLFLGVPVVMGAALAVVALWPTSAPTPVREDVRHAPVTMAHVATEPQAPSTPAAAPVVTETVSPPSVQRRPTPRWVSPYRPESLLTSAPVAPRRPAVLRLEHIYDTPPPQLERILYPDNYDWRGRR